MTSPNGINFRALRRWSFALGGIAFIVLIVAACYDPMHAFRAYLFAFLFWLGIPLGCLGLLMLYHLVGGAWALASRNLIESAAWTLPGFFLASIPILAGAPLIYPWANGYLPPGQGLTGAKAFYFQKAFFLTRAATYFLCWCATAWVMKRRAREHPLDTEAAPSPSLRVASGWGLVIYCLLASFAAFDWMMSLDPAWYSTVYGMLFVVGQGVSALSALILLLGILGPASQLRQIDAKALLDLGNLLLAFVMLWGYLAFMQYLIVWSGNLKEEIPWYLKRNRGGWKILLWTLFLFHFLAPFLMLLSRQSKKRIPILMGIAGCLLFSRLVDYFWSLGPLKPEAGLPLHWTCFVAPIALGAVWFGDFLLKLSRYDRVMIVSLAEKKAS